MIGVVSNDPYVHYLLGFMLLQGDDLVDALKEFNWLMENFPKEPTGYAMHAITLIKLKDKAGVIKDLSLLETFHLDSLSIDVVQQVATVYNSIGRFNRGMLYAERAIRLEPSSASLALKGWSLFGLKSYTQAIEILTSSITLKPEPIAYLFRGQSYFGLKNYLKAESDLKKCVELNPKSEDAYAFLGYTYQNKKNMKEACGCWKKAVEISPGSDVQHDIDVHCK